MTTPNNKINKLSRIEAYIQKGDLSDDIAVYEKEGVLWGCCPFCDDKPIGDEVFELSGEENEIEVKDKFGEYTFKVRVCRIHYPTIERQITTDYLTHNSRLRGYLSSGNLPDDADMYQQGRLGSGQCVFCTKELDKYEYYQSLYPEEGKYQDFGGPTTCCQSCLKAIDCNGDYEIIEAAEDLLEDVCAKCDIDVYITAEEYQARYSKGTLGEHVCNECMFETPDKKYQGVPRFLTSPCQTCGSTNVIDLSLKEVYDSNGFTEGCNTCSHVQHIYYLYENLLYCKVYIGEEATWHYTLYETSIDGPPIKLVNSQHKGSEGQTTSWMAMHKGMMTAIAYDRERGIYQEIQQHES